MAMIDVKVIADLTPQLLKIPYNRIWSSYDKEVDDYCFKCKQAASL